MNYHNITTDDMLNGEGLRVVLWVSGCSLHCKNCHNPQTWDFNSGIEFTEETMNELLDKLDKPYISGLTISGGHPLEEENIQVVFDICQRIKRRYPTKNIWIYSGYTWETILKKYHYTKYEIIFEYIDILVDGAYIDEQRDLTLAYRGSSNQRVIDVQESLRMTNGITHPVLYCE